MVVANKFLHRLSKLSHVVDTLNLQCSSLDLSNRRQQKRGKNCDDGNDHQQFNQRERRIFFFHVQSAFHLWPKNYFRFFRSVSAI